MNFRAPLSLATVLGVQGMQVTSRNSGKSRIKPNRKILQ